jgi:hypothetical protein
MEIEGAYTVATREVLQEYPESRLLMDWWQASKAKSGYPTTASLLTWHLVLHRDDGLVCEVRRSYA